MKDFSSYVKGKKITVAGLGLLGRGVGDVAFLAQNGAELIVTDIKTDAELQSSVEKLKAYPNITFVFGEHREEDFTGRDFILKGPTVPPDSAYMQRAKKEGIPIKMSASWFAELSGIPIVGVTGTRGKTTTTYMLKNIMEAAGMRVLLGGNIRGVSTLSLLEKVMPDSVALLELDSWQCWGFGEAGISPNISVFTNFFPDHLNYYQGDMDAYFRDKAQIFLHQGPEDTLIIGPQTVQYMGLFGKKIISHVVITDPARFPKDWELAVPGEHNIANAACALEAARSLSIDDEVIRQTLATFVGVPGRLELVREVNGVQIFNDTTATIPEATIAALHALDPDGKKNIILIMGGADKGLDMAPLLEELPRHTKKVVALEGSGTERLKPELEPAMLYHSTLAGAVREAIDAAHAGDIILFSPAFASFGMFTNEFDRGDRFNALVKSL